MDQSIANLAKSGSQLESLLTAIYGDLAAPGVKQVGRALATIVETGCLALLPLRLLNDRARVWEERTYREFGERMATMPDEDVIPIVPELGVPILDRLTQTTQAELRDLFLNLLTSSASKHLVDSCHPSYAHVISLLSPDEARLISTWTSGSSIPFVNVAKRDGGNSHQSIARFVMDAPDSLDHPQNLQVYISNLTGLGIISHATDSWMADKSEYEGLISHVSKTWPSIVPSAAQEFDFDRSDTEIYIYFEKGHIQVEPYGSLLQRACVRSETEKVQVPH